ncbi:unnamed protein product [Cylindrotheca closterium]|uniref:CRC domain-containing protein n=1 Tax=Cylindrotheca closterium TaxID=2856 RepID=A0AAD2CAU5_9STRA|nr:unnamed protein product [Cylindrotheca closterium]
MNTSHIPPNTIAVQCMTRTTVVMDNHPSSSFPVPAKKNNKENSHSIGKQDVHPSNKPIEEQLHIQFQSSSGPPKKRLSPKRGSTNVGGKFEKKAPAIKKSKCTGGTIELAPKTTNQTKQSTRPSQSFEKGSWGKNLGLARKAVENTNSEGQHDRVNAALYPSHPSDAYYQHHHHGTHHHHHHHSNSHHAGLKVQFMDGVPHNDQLEKPQVKRVYKFGHIPALEQPADRWRSLVSLGQKYQSRATVHNSSHPYMSTQNLPHPASQYYITPEIWHLFMKGPLIGTPESLYCQLHGSPQSSTAKQVPVPSAKQHSPSSAGPSARFAQPMASTNAPGNSATKPQLRSVEPVPLANPAGKSAINPQPHSTQPVASTNPPGKNVGNPLPSSAQPVPLTNLPGKYASKPQTDCNTPKKKTTKKTLNLALLRKLTNKPLVTTQPCKCKKSQCLKLYCECFKIGRICAVFCKCNNCKNKKDQFYKDSERAIAIKEILRSKPTAFQTNTNN